MFLLRAAFWLSVVVILLPGDPDTGEDAPRVTAIQALWAAQGAVQDLSQFCARNPDVCETSGTAFHVFADKVRYGTKMLYGYFGEDGTDGDQPIPARETLTPEDIEPEWQAVDSEKAV
jgi:hypothetical protein